MSLRLGGQCLLIGGIGSILSTLLVFLIPGPDGITGPGSIPADIFMILGGVLLLIGMPTLYRAQARQIGRLGLVGVALLMVAVVLGWVILSGIELHDVAVPGSIPRSGPDGPPPLAMISAALGGLFILVGGLIMGISTIRAQVFPSAVGWVMLIASVLLMATIAMGNANRMLDVSLTSSEVALLCAGLAWAGATLSFRRITPEVA
jgi:hypothetical protein